MFGLNLTGDREFFTYPLYITNVHCEKENNPLRSLTGQFTKTYCLCASSSAITASTLVSSVASSKVWKNIFPTVRLWLNVFALETLKSGYLDKNVVAVCCCLKGFWEFTSPLNFNSLSFYLWRFSILADFDFSILICHHVLIFSSVFF